MARRKKYYKSKPHIPEKPLPPLDEGTLVEGCVYYISWSMAKQAEYTFLKSDCEKGRCWMQSSRGKMFWTDTKDLTFVNKNQNIKKATEYLNKFILPRDREKL